MNLLKPALTTLMLSSSLLSHAPATADEPRLNVVASFSIIEDLARQIGGEHIAITSIVGANTDAHIYEPTPTDVRNLVNADIVLINGLMFEGFLTRLVEASDSRAQIVTLSDSADIIEDPLGGHYHFHGDNAVFHAAPNDPHTWQSVKNVQAYSALIASVFCDADPHGCDDYQENQQRYQQALEDLEQEIHAQISNLPESRRTVVVAHHAFRYFENAYGITFLSPQGVSTEAEATATHVAHLVDALKQREASAIFAENISNPRLVEQIANDAGTTVSGTLYSDALSDQDGPASSYIDMIRHNLNTLVSALEQP